MSAEVIYLRKPMSFTERLLAALYVSETWYSPWLTNRKPHYRARAMVSYDRMLNEEWHRMGGGG